MPRIEVEATPKRLNHVLVELDMLNHELAEEAGVSPRSVYRWLAGTTPIPRSVMVMLELMRRKA
jgi:predicted transcriptional regulator